MCELMSSLHYFRIPNSLQIYKKMSHLKILLRIFLLLVHFASSLHAQHTLSISSEDNSTMTTSSENLALLLMRRDGTDAIKVGTSFTEINQNKRDNFTQWCYNLLLQI